MPHSIEVAADIVVWINIAVLILTILVFVYTSYLTAGQPIEEQIAAKKIVDLMLLGFLILFLSSFLGFILTVLIGNWGWLVALLFTLLVMYSTAKYRDSK